MPSSTAIAIYCIVTSLFVISATLWVLRMGLGRASLNTSSGRRSLGVTAIILAIWYLGLTILGARGFFAATLGPGIPTLPLAIFLAIPIGVWYAFGSSAIRKAVAALPLPALVALQIYRANGLIFVLYTLRGDLPILFGLTAGLGDIAVGLLAIVSARMLARGSAFARPVAYLWNALGLLDLVIGLTLGFLSSPTPLQRFAFDHPNTLISTYPLVMIPVFVVPLSFVLHILSLRQLRQSRILQEQRSGQAQTPMGTPAPGHLR
jgi:hypothetical protein